MKVLFIIDSLQQGGAEQSLVHTIHHFPKELEVTVVYLYPKENLLSELQQTGCSIHGLKLNRKWSWLDGVSKLKKIISETKPSVMVSCLYDSNIISRIVSKQTGVPLIGTLVSDSYSNIRVSSFGWKRKMGFYLFYLIDRLTAKIPVAWIANSQSIKTTNASKLNIPEQKIKVIYRGRNVALFQEWQTPDLKDGFRFAFIGRLLETKGLKELIKAFKKIAAQSPEVRLDIYGEGPFRSNLEVLVRQNDLADKVTLHGNVKEAWSQLYKAHVFVFPSWYEGFSGALVEAMMVGLPIIASDIPMNLEAVEAGKTAFVFSVKDEIKLIAAMQAVHQNYHSGIAMARIARNSAFNRFDIATIASQYAEILIYYGKPA